MYLLVLARLPLDHALAIGAGLPERVRLCVHHVVPPKFIGKKSNGKPRSSTRTRTNKERRGRQGTPSSSADMSGKDGEAPDLISSWTRSRSRAQCAGEPRRLGLRFSPPCLAAALLSAWEAHVAGARRRMAAESKAAGRSARHARL